MEKSTIFMAGITQVHRNNILQHFPFEVGSLPVHYPGLPLLTKCMNASNYLPLLEKIRSRITSWTGRFLSFAGRLQLIKSVLSSLTNFWLAAFRLPNSCIKELDKLFAAFLWSGPELNARKAKIAWHVVCRPKNEGRLGLRSLKDVNMVSVLKLIWRLLSARNSLWVQWVHKNLIRQGTLWTVKANMSSGSWMWKKILKYRDKAQVFFKLDVKSGRLTSFWHDLWSPMGKFFDHLGSRGIIDMGIANHASVATVMETHRRRRHRMNTLNQIEDHIDIARHASNDGDDCPLWRFKNDCYKRKF